MITNERLAIAAAIERSIDRSADRLVARVTEALERPRTAATTHAAAGGHSAGDRGRTVGFNRSSSTEAGR
jgi:hypothetical protein